MTKLTPELKSFLEDNGYFDLQVINGEVVGLMKYFTTVGVVIELTEFSYSHRYCFQDQNEAIKSLKYYSENPTIEKLTGNWIKVKGIKNGIVLDDFNPNWISD